MSDTTVQRPRRRDDHGGARRDRRKGAAMKASAGDRIIIKGHRIGQPDRDGEILEVCGDAGGPPYRVRWEDDGHEGLFFPGSDASIHHFVHRPGSARRRRASSS